MKLSTISIIILSFSLLQSCTSKKSENVKPQVSEINIGSKISQLPISSFPLTYSTPPAEFNYSDILICADKTKDGNLCKLNERFYTISIDSNFSIREKLLQNALYKLNSTDKEADLVNILNGINKFTYLSDPTEQLQVIYSKYNAEELANINIPTPFKMSLIFDIKKASKDDFWKNNHTKFTITMKASIYRAVDQSNPLSSKTFKISSKYFPYDKGDSLIPVKGFIIDSYKKLTQKFVDHVNTSTKSISKVMRVKGDSVLSNAGTNIGIGKEETVLLFAFNQDQYSIPLALGTAYPNGSSTQTQIKKWFDNSLANRIKNASKDKPLETKKYDFYLITAPFAK
jgi:hypothetical protein